MKIAKLVALFAITASLVVSRTTSAQGTLQVEGKDYKLDNVVAYRTKFFDNDAIVVLACSKPIPMEKLKNALKAGNDDDFNLFEPHVKMTFDPSGTLQAVFAWANNTSMSYSGSIEGAAVEADFANYKAHGKVRVAKEKCKFDVAFDAPIIMANPIEKK